MHSNLLKSLANCIRSLGTDTIFNAKFGHIGMVLGMADIVSVLYLEFLKFNPNNPKWTERDRFILSNGHGSAMLYSLFYLTGYKDISINDLKAFGRLNSKTACHPEYNLLSGIETTTGLLGQGIANAIGMAISSKKNGDKNKIYCTVGDGCLTEGISYEAMSLAGHLKLNNLVVIFDDNSMTIDGKLDLSFSENHEQRFLSQNWSVIKIDGHNIDEIRNAFETVKNIEKPTIIIAKTIIGYGSKYQNTNMAHGSVIDKEVKYNNFEIPLDLLQIWRNAWKRNESIYIKNIKKPKTDDLSNFFEQMKSDVFLDDSMRKIMGQILDKCYKKIPNLIGGSADLAISTCVKTANCKDITADDFSGNFINYGAREHAMGAIVNGITLYGDFIVFGSTFLVFADYMVPAIRMAALMKIKSIFIFTHDSICVGENGPTHQPVEQLSNLNTIPNLLVIRPASQLEAIDSIQIALQSDKPTAILCARQNIKKNFITNLDLKNYVKFGAYFVIEKQNAKCVIVASGSEVGLAFDVVKNLEKQGIIANLVSMPCCKLFDMQSQEYQDKILGRTNKLLKIGIEAGSQQNMAKYLDFVDLFFGVDKFGYSASSGYLCDAFGLTVANISNKIINLC